MSGQLQGFKTQTPGSTWSSLSQADPLSHMVLGRVKRAAPWRPPKKCEKLLKRLKK